MVFIGVGWDTSLTFIIDLLFGFIIGEILGSPLTFIDLFISWYYLMMNYVFVIINLVNFRFMINIY